MDKNNQSETSAFLFTTPDDSKKRFGIDHNENVYSRDSQPARDIFQKRMARRYHSQNTLSHRAEVVIDILVSILASGNEKIAVHKYCFAPLKKLLDTVTEIHGIRTIEFTDENSLQKAVNTGVKAVFLSAANTECNVPSVSRCADIAHTQNIPLIVDNTITTFCIVNPFDFGADIVMEFSGVVSVDNSKNTYVTLIDINRFDWSHKNKYVRIFPFLKYSAPFTSCMRFKCRKSAPVLSKENQAEFFMLCEGLKTLDNRMTVHSENAKTVAEIMQSYADDICLQTFPNGNAMLLKATLRPENADNIRLSLYSITVKNIRQFYHTYSCTAVCFQGNTLYIKCGTEPENYIRHIFTL